MPQLRFGSYIINLQRREDGSVAARLSIADTVFEEIWTAQEWGEACFDLSPIAKSSPELAARLQLQMKLSPERIAYGTLPMPMSSATLHGPEVSGFLSYGFPEPSSRFPNYLLVRATRPKEVMLTSVSFGARIIGEFGHGVELASFHRAPEADREGWFVVPLSASAADKIAPLVGQVVGLSVVATKQAQPEPNVIDAILPFQRA